MPENNLIQEILERARDFATASSKRLSTSFVLLAVIESSEDELKETLELFNLTLDSLTTIIVNDATTEHEGLLRSVVQSIPRMAQLSKNNQIELIHILLGLLVVPHTKVMNIFDSMEVDIGVFQSRLYQIAGIAQPKNRPAGQIIGPGKKPIKTQSPVKPVTVKLDPIKFSINSVLKTLSKDLTFLASQGKIDPIIGRQEEIKRAFQILCRRRKNNPVFIGDAGVGKTAIAEGIARMIVFQNANVPERLKDKRIFALNVSGIVAGTQFRGSFESKMQKLLQELQDHPEIIIFLDELHTIVGAGSSSGSDVDIGNILKPALARGDIKCMGATTLDEYRKIEKDTALERRFQPVMIDQPTPDETFRILNKVVGRYETYHNVHYQDSAIEAAVRLSVQYIPDRNLPDKAIDVIDEAGSRKNICGSNTVTEDDIADVVSSWAGVMILTSKEQKKRILGLEKNLKLMVIGQDHAVEAICRRMVALRQPDRPIGSFIFLGPTGVGKTLLAKKLAEQLFGDENSMIRLNMSEYQEKHTVSRLVGAPPGYIGHDEGGQLTEKVKRKPFSVVLFDEIEKAHVDIFDVLLQILDDGQLTDGQGRTVSFKNTIIIMTSNIRPNSATGTGLGFGAKDVSKSDKISIILRKYGFKSEFLNRIDETVLFISLNKKVLRQIVELELEKAGQIVSQHKMELSPVNQVVKNYLIEKGYSSEYGARELRRTVEKLILTPLGRIILEGKFKEGDEIKTKIQTGKIVFTK
ncbi:ATP-dependent Clp protease ATP-binding subunit [Patescibacteria group bacterium]